MSSNRIWAVLGVGLMGIFGAQVLKAKQKVDDKQTGGSPEGRSFAVALNESLSHTRSVRIPGALTRPEIDPDSEPVPGWDKVTDSIPVLKNSPLESMQRRCLHQEEWFKQYPHSIFCGWHIYEERSAAGDEPFWRLKQTVFFKLPETVQG
jgi:hypothetical protein